MNKKPILIIADMENRHRYHSFALRDETIQYRALDDCLDLIKQESIDCIVLDCGLHAWRGLHLLKNIKLHSPMVPVIFCADQGSEEVAVAAFRSGARDYVQKRGNHLELKTTIHQLLAAVRNVHEKRARIDLSGSAVPSRPVPGSESDQCVPFHSIIQYIEQNLPSSIELGILAHQANLSKYHFCRMFKKITGSAPMKYVLNLRIEKAKELLRSKHNTVLSVAFQVGFKDVSNFTKQFKKMTGMTPAFYKQLAGHSHMPVRGSALSALITKRTNH